VFRHVSGRLLAEAHRNRPNDRMIHAHAFVLEGARGTLRLQASGGDVASPLILICGGFKRAARSRGGGRRFGCTRNSKPLLKNSRLRIRVHNPSFWTRSWCADSPDTFLTLGILI
jgi:hypothetical protein